MKIKTTLTEQLLLICIIIVSIILISLGIILPKYLLPIYEENIYNKLKQPLIFVNEENDFGNNTFNKETDIAYIYIDVDDNIYTSQNLSFLIGSDNVNEIINDFTEQYGKITFKKNIYYYNTSENSLGKKISITNDDYINQMKRDIYYTIFLIVGIAFIVISFIVLIWSNNLVNRIKKLKEKVDNIDSDDDTIDIHHRHDELYSLDVAVDDMKKYLRKQDEYKNQMYQNISHDFKTPITVMKSYIEASEDGMETTEKTFQIVKEQLNKLELKVHSLLYLNKLNYYKEKKENLNVSYDVSIVLQSSVEKFKLTRPDVEFIIDLDKKNTIFRGSENMWEAIIDNILNNFIRYAKKKIKITVKNNKIIFYNDGPNIDSKSINNIFTPYEKGINGVFGLGLSIVKKTVNLLEYDIDIENIKNGIKFIIKERN